MDAALDTGDIIVQSEVTVFEEETLATYYTKLHKEILQLFETHWDSIRSGTCPRQPQEEGGSYHRAVDKGKFAGLLAQGADTPVSELVNFNN